MATYNQVIASAQPFFFSRGWAAFGWLTMLLFYLNNTVQDVFNNDNSTFTYKTLDSSQYVTDAKGRHVFTADFPIRKIQKITAYNDGNWPEELTPILGYPSDQCDGWCKFTTGEKEIIVDGKFKRIEVSYIMDYEWATEEDLNKNIPLPNRYLPAVIKLLYDWASPVNLMAGEAQQVDFYSHAMSRLRELATEDSLTDAYTINPSR